MKKFILLSLLFISTAATSLAIPPGSYVDDRGRKVFLVSRDGKEIYRVNKEGKVLTTQDVIDEQYDHEAKAVKVRLRTRGMNVETAIYYRENSNGDVQIDDGMKVLHRE